jgi:hypothetical protein
MITKDDKCGHCHPRQQHDQRDEAECDEGKLLSSHPLTRSNNRETHVTDNDLFITPEFGENGLTAKPGGNVLGLTQSERRSVGSVPVYSSSGLNLRISGHFSESGKRWLDKRWLDHCPGRAGWRVDCLDARRHPAPSVRRFINGFRYTRGIRLRPVICSWGIETVDQWRRDEAAMRISA